MERNKLMGAGPSIVGNGSSAPGPSPGMQGTNGVAPQAPPNMLSAPQPGQGQPQAGMPMVGGGQTQQRPQQPPSPQMLKEMMHKIGYVNSMLKGLLGKPDLTPRDVINSVGVMVGDGLMPPFTAAKYLSDLPTDQSTIRQWVAGHFATSSQNFAQVTQMLQASGVQYRQHMAQSAAMMRSMAAPAAAAPPSALTPAMPGA